MTPRTHGSFHSAPFTHTLVTPTWEDGSLCSSRDTHVRMGGWHAIAVVVPTRRMTAHVRSLEPQVTRGLNGEE
ncbi:MAG: hypothetical protein GF411_13915 [Candidatus Lokiarchaeota archaeon]|nr:hypothetical protein [Candidatus Lokiarchaeota archaeon]